MELTVSKLAEHLQAELSGDGTETVHAVDTLHTAGPNTVTFCLDKTYFDQVKNAKASAVIVPEPIDDLAIPQIIVNDAKKALVQTLTLLAPKLQPQESGIHKTAVVSESANIGKNTSIGAHVVVGPDVQIGENCIIAAGCKIGEKTTIANNTKLDANTVVYPRTKIGNHVIILANTTIGSTGFGYYFLENQHQLIPHNGIVVIEDCVHIGANCCIDRAKFGETRIGAGTKIDNLVQIAHNVIIGKCCLIAAQVGIAGSVIVGDGVIFGGQVGVTDNTNIQSGVIVLAQSGVTHHVPDKKIIAGLPATDVNQWRKSMVITKNLPKYVDEIRELKKRVQQLEASKNNKK